MIDNLCKKIVWGFVAFIIITLAFKVIVGLLIIPSFSSGLATRAFFSTEEIIVNIPAMFAGYLLVASTITCIMILCRYPTHFMALALYSTWLCWLRFVKLSFYYYDYQDVLYSKYLDVIWSIIPIFVIVGVSAHISFQFTKIYPDFNLFYIFKKQQ